MEAISEAAGIVGGGCRFDVAICDLKRELEVAICDVKNRQSAEPRPVHLMFAGASGVRRWLVVRRT
jgi:hypothetical protein